MWGVPSPPARPPALTRSIMISRRRSVNKPSQPAPARSQRRGDWFARNASLQGVAGGLETVFRGEISGHRPRLVIDAVVRQHAAQFARRQFRLVTAPLDGARDS